MNLLRLHEDNTKKINYQISKISPKKFAKYLGKRL